MRASRSGGSELNTGGSRWTGTGVMDDPASMVPIVESPDAISVIVVGGAGKHSSWQPTFGRQTRPVTREITRR